MAWERQHVIGIGIVGTHYGRAVLLPAFRADSRCKVTALCGSDYGRTRALADEAGVPKAFADWRLLVDDQEVQAVAVATPPDVQPDVAVYALGRGKPVFAEKPMASRLAGARLMLDAAHGRGVAAMVDFNFHKIQAFQKAKDVLDTGAIGVLRHVTVHWHVENRSVQQRLQNWKTLIDSGGGVLGNFVSHCFHYLEWFCGPLAGLSARLQGPPGDDMLQTTATMTLAFASGPPASLSVSCASYLGSGHRLEFYGEDGTLVLDNTGADYMRGFNLLHARRPVATLARIPVDDPDDARYADGRIAPVSRLVKGFLDAIESERALKPGFADGYRVQQLLDAATISNRDGRWIDVRPEVMELT
jgi:predicted dehydrogenase